MSVINIRNNSKKDYLSKEEEMELGWIIKRYKEKDPNISEEMAREAHNTLFENNVDYVYNEVHKFLKRTNSYYYEPEDAFQDALTELAYRLWEYDPSYDTRAITKIYWNIKKVLSTKANKSRPIPLSDIASWKYSQIYKFSNLYDEEKGNLTISKIDYIESNTGFSREEITTLMATSSSNIVSLNYSFNNNDNDSVNSLGDIISIEEVDNSISYETDLLLSYLSPEDRRIISYEYDLENNKDIPLNKILADFGLTEKQYKAKVRRITKKLREIARDKEIMC